MLLPAIGFADVYAWTDENGVKHFSNSPPANAGGEVRQAEEVGYDDQKNVAPQTSKADPQAQFGKPDKNGSKESDKKRQRIGNPGVVMYATPTCGYCQRARAFFKHHKIRFVERDITTSKEARRKFKALNGRGVPLIVIGNTKISGFNVSAIKKALNING